MTMTIQTADPAIRPLEHFRGARDAAAPADRLAEIRKRAWAFRDTFLADAPVVFYASIGLVRVPYPRKYALRDAALVPTPMVHIVNRLFVVQYRVEAGSDEIRTLLFSPSDLDANRATPFFARLAAMMGPLANLGQQLIGPILNDVPSALAGLGIAPEQVDYLSYDHLHTQDLRRWLGTNGAPGFFPNAKLLVTRQEWASAQGLLPQQQVWYCPDGTTGIDPDRIVCFDGDIRLGEGVVLMSTPGHTEGNHSLVARTPEGIMVSSENGVGPDAYAPHASRIPGLAAYARRTGMEVVLNGNTLEGAVDQYLSMLQEREVAGASVRNPDFANVVSSSELAGYWAFPGITPTFSFGDLRFGEPVTT